MTRSLWTCLAGLTFVLAACSGSSSSSEASDVLRAAATTSTIPVRSTAGSAPAGAKPYLDPDGRFRIWVDPNWKFVDSVISKLLTWYTADPVDGVASNVVVATAPSGGVDLPEFLVRASTKRAERSTPWSTAT
jgi:hypothetical protein